MAEHGKFRFVVECEPAAEALPRLLDRVVQAAAAIETVEHGQSGDGARTVLRLSSLGRADAEALRGDLQALPFVRTVGFGW